MAVVKRASGPGKNTRSEVVSVRFDPKLRYLTELAARKHRRSVSSYIEWAVENSLKSVTLYDGSGNFDDPPVSVEDESRRLWDVSEPERLVRLAVLYPELMTIDEQMLWKLIQDAGLTEVARFREMDGSIQWNWFALEDVVFPNLRKYWEELVETIHEGSSVDRNNFIQRIRREIQ